jgi:hypothetical protein
MVAVLPTPSPENSGQECRILIETPAGPLTVVATPGKGSDGKVFQPTINGSAQATYALPGVVTLVSNGVSDWKTLAEVPAETEASEEQATLIAGLSATYHLETTHPSLPNARVATSSPEIEVDNTTPGAVSWKLGFAARNRGVLPLAPAQRGRDGLPGMQGRQGPPGPQGPPGTTVVHRETRVLMPAAVPVAQRAPAMQLAPPPAPTIFIPQPRPLQPPPLNPIPRDYFMTYRGFPDNERNAVPAASGIPNIHPNWIWRHYTFEGGVNNLFPVGGTNGFTAGGDMTFSQRPSSASRFGLGLRCSVPLGSSGYAHLGNLASSLTFDDPETLRGFRVLLELQTTNPGADYDFAIGFGSDISAGAADDAIFGAEGLFLSASGTGLWRRVRRTGGVATAANGSAIVVGDIYLLEYYQTTPGSPGTWTHYINGVSQGGGSTNGPTSGLNFGWAMRDDTGGAADFVVDIYQIDIFTDELAQRYS